MKRLFKLGIMLIFLLVGVTEINATSERAVVIDPGHGGKDSGTSGNGFLEKDLNLDIAWAVTNHLRENGVTVYMTRETDKTMELAERSKFVNSISPDLTVSIHNDYSTSGKGDGSHVIYSHWDKSGGTTKTLARNILESIVDNTGQNKSSQDIWYRIIDSGDKKGLDYYHIIREIKTPAVIVECAFVNTVDVTSLNHDDIMPLAVDTPDKRYTMGVAIAEGILQTLDEIKPISQKEYVGNINTDVQHVELSRNQIGDYLYGEIVIVEWVDGKSTVPSTLPKMYLKSKDGSFVKELFVTKTGTNTYYFDGFINDIDKSKNYYIEATLTNDLNVGQNKSMIIKTDKTTFPVTQQLGYLDGEMLNCELVNRILNFNFGDMDYIGNVNTELRKISLDENAIGKYLNGEVIVVEWVNDYSTVPRLTPNMYLKSTDGLVTKKLFVTPTGTNTYYFDGFIDELDMTKDYFIEVESASKNNISNAKAMNLKTDNSPLILSENTLGMIRNYEAYYSTEEGQLKLSFFMK